MTSAIYNMFFSVACLVCTAACLMVAGLFLPTKWSIRFWRAANSLMYVGVGVSIVMLFVIFAQLY